MKDYIEKYTLHIDNKQKRKNLEDTNEVSSFNLKERRRKICKKKF